MKTIKVASLFAGGGGGCLGILGGFDYLGQTYARNATEIVFANEIDKHACTTYRANFLHKITEGDICKIASVDIPNFDILVGGFPCQSFSMAGKRLGFEEEKGLLFMQIVRLLQDKQPKSFICENVKGLLSSGDGKDFAIIYKHLKDCGYSVFFKVLNAANYGVPQNRKRVFIVGFRNDLNVNYFDFPTPLPEPVALKEVLEVNPERHIFTDRQVLMALDYMATHKGFKKLRAQDTNKPCATLTAHMRVFSPNGTDPILFINGKYFRFTLLEGKRIQSLPDDFIFPVPEAQAWKQIGNSIAPVVMHHLINQVLKAL